MNRKCHLYALILTGLFATLYGCNKEGCPDPQADNYNDKATVDDGSCIYTDSAVIVLAGDITTPTLLGPNTYKICADINVVSDLEILPGASFIMCNGSSITVMASGSLNAVGTEIAPIVFEGETKTKGAWVGIGFRSDNNKNEFNHVTIKYAGSYNIWEFSSLFIDNDASISIENSVIEQSKNFGLLLADNAALTSFKNNTFRNNVTGISLPVNQVEHLDSTSNYNEGNANNFIAARTGTISNFQEWQPTSTPLLIDSLIVEGGLVLMANSNLLMNMAAGIYIINSGYLFAEGTADKPITIRGKEQIAGYWAGINIESNVFQNYFNYLTVSDGGKTSDNQFANIMVTGTLDLQNSTIENANNYGVYRASSGTLLFNGSPFLNPSAVEAENSFLNNGNGPNANCTNTCSVFFE